MRRWTRCLTLAALLTLALAATGHPSASAACPPLDAACHLDEVLSAREGIVDDVIDPIETPVDDILGGGPVDLPDPLDLPDPIDVGGGGGSHVGEPAAGHDPPRTQSPHVPDGRGPVMGRNPDAPGSTTLPGPAISAASGTAPSDSTDRPSGNRVGEVVGGVARSLAIVLALFGLAVAFVSIQDRFDRHDPRLALAPVESDVVEFA